MAKACIFFGIERALRDVLGVLEESYPKALSVKALVLRLPHIGYVNLRQTLKHMAEDGQIKKSAKGEYSVSFASLLLPHPEVLSHQEHSPQPSQVSQSPIDAGSNPDPSHQEHLSQASQSHYDAESEPDLSNQEHSSQPSPAITKCDNKSK